MRATIDIAPIAGAPGRPRNRWRRCRAGSRRRCDRRDPSGSPRLRRDLRATNSIAFGTRPSPAASAISSSTRTTTASVPIRKSSTSNASQATGRSSARTGTPTPRWWRSRRWVPSSMPSRCRPMAAIRCSPTSISRPTAWSGLKRARGPEGRALPTAWWPGPQAGMNAHRSTKVREDANWRETISVHPVVRTHPETGRKLLFVSHAPTPSASRAGQRQRASRCWNICWNTAIAPSLPAASDGRTAPSRSGTIAVPNIWPCTVLPARSAASCGAPSAATPCTDRSRRPGLDPRPAS